MMPSGSPSGEPGQEAAAGVSVARVPFKLSPRDELHKKLAVALVIPTQGTVRAPVVTLANEALNLYPVIERHLRADAAIGVERFWRLVKGCFVPQLETWRPRVHGAQLKALQNARLPEGELEWENVEAVLEELKPYLREGKTPRDLLLALKDLVSQTESWWDGRTKRESGGHLGKRPAQHGGYHSNKRGSAAGGGHMDVSRLGEVDVSLAGAYLPQGPKFGSYGGALKDLATVATETAHPSSGALPPDAIPGKLIHTPPSSAGLGGYVDLMTGDPHAAASPHGGLHHPPDSGSGGPAPQNGLANGHMPGAGGRGGMSDAWLEARLVAFNVGGQRFACTAATLAQPEGQGLWRLAVQASATKQEEVFIDRTPQVFEHVLQHLRGQRMGKEARLPASPALLELLLDDAEFYCMPGLADRARAELRVASSAGAGSPGSTEEAAGMGMGVEAGMGGGGGEPWEYAMAYSETGFQNLEDPVALRQRQEEISAELARIRAEHSAQGYEIEPWGCHSGMYHRNAGESNWYFSMLFKRRHLPPHQQQQQLPPQMQEPQPQ